MTQPNRRDRARVITLLDGMTVTETDTIPVIEDEAYYHKIERLGFAVKTLNSALKDIGVQQRVVLYSWTPDERSYNDGANAIIRIAISNKGGLEL